MDTLAYILDTNVISDYINFHEPTVTRVRNALRERHILYLCSPVIYEVTRGLLKAQAIRKQHLFNEEFVPLLTGLPLTDDDWRQAAHLWAEARMAGKQLSDIDLLLAALAIRYDAHIVSDDTDFDALPVRRENWRQPADPQENFDNKE